MSFKPLTEQLYRKYIKMVGWNLVKGSIDYKLYNEKDEFVCSIKISHGKNTDKGVVADSIKKTKDAFKARGWEWPPKKKSKNT